MEWSASTEELGGGEVNVPTVLSRVPILVSNQTYLFTGAVYRFMDKILLICTPCRDNQRSAFFNTTTFFWRVWLKMNVHLWSIYCTSTSRVRIGGEQLPPTFESG